MKIPKEIQELAQKLTGERIAKKREEKAKRVARERAEEARRQEWIGLGLPHAQKIFDWADEFRKDKTGKRIIKLGTRSFLGGVMFFDDTLKGHAFRGLGVSMTGVWWIMNGCGAHPRDVESPEDLAGEIEPEILAAAVANIENGKVWETIKERWEIKE